MATSFGASGAWRTNNGDDWKGTNLIGDPGPSCTGQSLYSLSQRTQTAQARWSMIAGVPDDTPNYCDVWVYVPTQVGGDRHARYDFWDTSKGWRWLAWPGHTIDQLNISGWYEIASQFNLSGVFSTFTVTLSNQDAISPGWDAGVGDAGFYCYN